MLMVELALNLPALSLLPYMEVDSGNVVALFDFGSVDNHIIICEENFVHKSKFYMHIPLETVRIGNIIQLIRHMPPRACHAQVSGTALPSMIMQMYLLSELLELRPGNGLSVHLIVNPHMFSLNVHERNLDRVVFVLTRFI